MTVAARVAKSTESLISGGLSRMEDAVVKLRKAAQSSQPKPRGIVGLVLAW